MHSDLVYDVGMNNGDDTAHYLARGFRVIAIEADPGMVKIGTERFPDAIRTGQLTILNVAIAPEPGRLPFYVSEGNRGVWSSFDRAMASRDGLPVRTEYVECVRLRDVFAQHGVPLYLKVDIEGADKYCIADLGGDDLPQYVSFEASEGQLADLFTLSRLGYTRFKLIDQLAGFAAVVPPPMHSLSTARRALREVVWDGLRKVPGLMRLRRMLERTPRAQVVEPPSIQPEFVTSSSGPMPDQTPGDWMTVEDTAYAWLFVKRLKNRKNWYDVHASR